VHVHGVEGVDVLDGDGAVATIANRLPRYGVTAFCPTTVASPPASLRLALDQIRRLRGGTAGRHARVLPAHLESNFINPKYRGAQPAACLRSPREALADGPASAFAHRASADKEARHHDHSVGDGLQTVANFSGADILNEIERAAPDVAMVTIAPELDGALDLVGWLVARGHRVSLGHSDANFDEAQAAIAAGARHATHLFNRMPPFEHRAPGLVGAILQSDEVVAEIICDGFHVHPAVLHTTVAAKRPSRVVAITDGTAASGLPIGARAALGGQPITVTESVARLDDGTMAGSVATMDRVFQLLVGQVGLSMIDAATVCATTAARELGLVGHGVIAVDAAADLTVLDANLAVVQTYVAGQLVYSRT